MFAGILKSGSESIHDQDSNKFCVFQSQTGSLKSLLEILNATNDYWAMIKFLWDYWEKPRDKESLQQSLS